MRFIMVPFLSLAFLFPQITSQEVGIGCFVQAECVGATSTGIAHAMNADDCYNLCSRISDCNFFTFYSEGNYCFLYSNCPSVNTDCEDCISGERECEVTCSSPGQCISVPIGVEDASKENTCIGFCHNSEECEYWTYREVDTLCSMFANCSKVDTTTCPSCVHGENSCRKEIETLFLYGGLSYGETIATVEGISLSGSIVSCPQVQDLPHEVSRIPGLSLDGQPVSCGGQKRDLSITNECYVFNSESGNWDQMPSMSQERYYHEGVQLTKTSFWITGGNDEGVSLSSTEIFQDGIFKVGPVLPLATYLHCIVKLNETHSILTGGSNVEIGTLDQVYMYDFIMDKWTELAPMQENRTSHACGLVTLSDDTKELVVAGGYHRTSVEIYNFETQTWRLANTMLDHEIDASTSVPFGDTFLIVGGKSLIKSANDIYFSDILEFNPTDETWITRPETVPNERSDLAALLVEDSILNCI